MKTEYCDNHFCENEAVETVPLSVRRSGDSERKFCAVCYEAYTIGVQHGRIRGNPEAYRETKPGSGAILQSGSHPQLAQELRWFRLVVRGIGRMNIEPSQPHKHIAKGATTRRSFLRKTTAAACVAVVAPQIVPSSVLGMGGKTLPNSRITVGFIGTGDHGVGWNLGPYLRHKDAQVVAACDVDGNRLFRAQETINDHYKNEDCFTPKDFREILARKDIDAVMISTPDHWHTLISIMAIQAGKDVQCEKPTLTINEGKLLIKAVRKHRKVFQTSTEDRAVPEYHRMAELVRNGRVGKLQRIEVILPLQPQKPGDPTPQPVPKELDYDMWLGPAPFAPYTRDRVHFNFRWIWDYSGGIICDWGAHLFDTAQWANDTERSGPVEIEGTGTYWTGGLYNTVKDYDVTYRYANGVVMNCKPGTPSIKFIGTEGWVGNTGWRAPVQASSPEILNAQIGPREVHLYTNPKGEHDDFLQCVRSRKDPYLPVDIGHRVSTVCHLANIAIRVGRKLKWNPWRERFDGDDEANRMLDRPRRAPWQLPKV